MFAEIRKEYLKEGALPFVLHTIGSCQEKRPVNRPQGFFCHHLLWVKQGKGLFTVDGGEPFLLSTGEGLFCRRGVPHAYSAAKEVLYTQWVTFFGADSILDYYQIPAFFRFKVSPSLCASTEELETLCTGNSTIISRSSAGYSWLSEWLDAAFSASGSLTDQIREYLEQCYGEPLDLEGIARQVGMNRFALCRSYKRLQGITVMEQLKRIRLSKAKQYLRFSAAPIAVIGQLCGFENASYFGKIFRENVGCSPGEYREQHVK